MQEVNEEGNRGPTARRTRQVRMGKAECDLQSINATYRRLLQRCLEANGLACE